MRRTRPALSPGVKKRIDEAAKKHRATAYKHIPNRGTTDPFSGETVAGLGRLTLKYRDLTNDELNTDAVDGRVLKAATVTDGHINGRLGKNSVPQINVLDGSLDGGKMQKRSIPADALSKVDGADLQDRSVGPDKIKGVRAEGVQGLPNFGEFVRQGETKKFLTKAEADRLYAPRKKKN